MKKIIKLMLVAVMTLSVLLVGCGGDKDKGGAGETAGEIKVGFIYIGPKDDGGFTYAHDQGRVYLEKELGVKTIYKESVKEDDNEVKQVVKNFIDQGANVIVGTSFGFQDGLVEMSEEYPDVKFLHCSGFKTTENMGQYFGRMYQARYLNGIVAGLKTKTNSIGYVGAFPLPEVIRGLNAFTLGVQSVNKDAKVKVNFTNTWYDPAKEHDAAIALLDQGVDVIAQHQDTAGPQQAAEKRGAFSIGYNSDMSKAAPKANMTSAMFNWGPYYVNAVKAIKDGSWETGKYWGGLEDDVIQVAPLTAIAPEGAQAKVEEATKAIKSGENKIFVGPIKNQKGEVVVPEGKTMTDDEIWSMDWLIEGVEGTIPAK